MRADGLPIHCLVAWALAGAGTGVVLAGCSAGSSGGGDDSPVVEAQGGAPAAPAGGGSGVLTPGEPGSEVIFEPGDVPVPGPEVPGAAAPRRRGLLDRQVSCDGDAKTTVSGTVYIPSGELPLYNVMVYVPDAELSPLTAGASCSCEISGAPIISALTDATGRFVLEDVPVGDDIPLVIQVGDWRREFNIGTVAGCVDTAIPDRTLKMPARRSEGDMPKIAVATGVLDALECLVLKLGVDPSEFTNPAEGGAVQLFSGYFGAEQYDPQLNGGAQFPPAEALWYDAESLEQFDMVLLSCEGDDYMGNKDERALQGMFEYANRGGRVFASHYQGLWFRRGPAPFSDLAEFTDEPDDQFDELSADIVTSFPKGEALGQWLAGTGIAPDGVVPIEGGARTILRENPDYAQVWLQSEAPASVQYISANTPLGAADADQCGRVVLSDIHVSAGGDDDDFSHSTVTFPNGCVSSGLSPQEAVLAFMLFDLSSCIVPDDQAPVAPPIIR